MNARDSGLTTARRWGPWLVLLQFGLLGLLAWRAASNPGPAFWRTAVLLPLAAGCALGLWALWANRPGNFHVRPLPKDGAELVLHGPYRWIRHPMYGALLLAAAAVVVATPDAVSVAAALALWAVLWLKSGVEEHAMRERHPAYADYCRGKGRFLPRPF